MRKNEIKSVKSTIFKYLIFGVYMTLLSLLSFLACGDKSITTDTADTNTSEPSSASPTDDPIIEEELEPLEAIAIGFEYVGTWNQSLYPKWMDT